MLFLSEGQAGKYEKTFGNRKNGNKSAFFLFCISLEMVNWRKKMVCIYTADSPVLDLK
jgi:hypothetical protein